MHLVGFIIRIYHDARSPERLYYKNKFEKLVHLVGFIVRSFVTMHGHLNVRLYNRQEKDSKPFS